MDYFKSYELFSTDTLTVYHGTSSKHAEHIRLEGLKSNNGYGSEWFMVATDLESALFHANVKDNEDFAIVFEFKIPILPIYEDFWIGYPYLWSGHDISPKSVWYGLREPLPIELLAKEHHIPYAQWAHQKSIKY